MTSRLGEELSRTHSGTTLLLVAFSAAAWMALRWPLPVWMLSDNDWVHQLGGANQILHGEHPFIDWHTDYGPLRYYPSALAQLVFGGRTLSELLLVTTAYTIAYTLLFHLMWVASGSRLIAGAMLLPALILAPRLYKYYVVLGPVVCLWAAWRDIARPSTTSLALLAAAVTATGLFRADFGAFAGLAAVVAIGTQSTALAERIGRLARFLALVLLFASPWLIWLGVRGGLPTYVADTLLNGPRHATAMALPFPRYDAARPLAAPNVTFFLFACFYALPPITLLAALWPGVCRDVAERRRMVTAAVLAQAVLVHAAHRSDYTHLLQAIAICFVPCAWLAGQVLSYRAPSGAARGFAAVARTALVGAVVVALWAGMSVGGFPSPQAGRGLRAWRVHAMQRDALLAHLAVEEPNNPLLQAILYIRRCTAPTDHIVALPPFIGAYYFSERSFGGTQPAWSPGFFSTGEDQQRWIERVRQEQVRLVLGDGSRMLDNRPDRQFANYSPLITQYVETAFVAIGRFGPIVVRASRPSPPWPTSGPPPCPDSAAPPPA